MKQARLSSSLLLLLATGGCLLTATRGQFLPAQSHLGRLVQSIASPLMLAPSAYRESAEAETPYPDPSSYYPQSGALAQGMNMGYQSAQQQLGHLGQIQPEASRLEQQTGRRLAMIQQQQAQSQQRGVHQPSRQHYAGYGPQSEAEADGAHNPNGDYGSSGPQGDEQADGRDQVGAAPSNHKQRNNPEYQMGAYLGPTIDDKEINGAFSSNNDERDEDDGPSSYDGPAAGSHAQQPRHKASSENYGSGSHFNGDSPSAAAYGNPHAGSANDEAGSYGQQPSANPNADRGAGYGPSGGSSYQGNGYDEDSVDEDEAPAQAPSRGAGRRGGQRHRPNSNQAAAASHFQQQGSYGLQEGAQQQQGGGPMMAAANGYAPFGYAGPVDLTGIMQGLSGDPSAGGYQVYGGGNSDSGAYNPGAAYYQQQGSGGNGNGRRNQAASMNSNYMNTNDGYGYGPMINQQQGSYLNQRQPQRPNSDANNDNDDHDGEVDDD